VDVYCIGETIAVPLFAALREACTVPIARRTLDRVLLDEVRHRDFGWLLLDHLLERDDSGAMRALVDADLPRAFARVRQEYAPSGVTKGRHLHRMMANLANATDCC
jgi:hypothetical protein